MLEWLWSLSWSHACWLPPDPEPSVPDSTKITKVPAAYVNFLFAYTRSVLIREEVSQRVGYLIDFKLASSVVCLNHWIAIIITAVTLQPLTPTLTPLLCCLISLLIIKHRVHKSSRFPDLQSWNPVSRQENTGCISHLPPLQVGFTGTHVTFCDNINNISVGKKKSELHLVFSNNPTWKKISLVCYVFLRQALIVIRKNKPKHVTPWDGFLCVWSVKF